MVDNERQYTVLVVDDNELHYELVADFLEEANFVTYTTHWAEDYNSALQFFEENTCDVCLLDYDLGNRSGLDFLREPIVQQSAIPIIFLTGRGSNEVDFDAMQAGVVDYMDKTQLLPDPLERAVRYAIERDRTLKAEQNHGLFLEALLSVISVLNSSLDFEDVITSLLTNIGKVIPHDIVDFMLVENGRTHIVKGIGYQDTEIEETINAVQFLVKDTPTFAKMTRTKKPLLIRNIADDPNWVSVDTQPIQSYLGAPVFSGNDLLGFINLNSYQADFFTKEHSDRLQIFAQQASTAIQNAQRHREEKERAANEERSRIAHELHDSVTQTLFSANVIAESLPRLMKIDIDATHDGLTRLAKITKSALAEMRTLLVELRPVALTDTPLDVLFLHLVNSMIVRLGETSLKLNTSGESYILPFDAQVTLYRVAQESLNNVMKHAHANAVSLTIKFSEDNVRLEVIDDGKGFDVNSIPADHMGIRIMYERAAQSDVDVNVISEIGKGTHIIAQWDKK